MKSMSMCVKIAEFRRDLALKQIAQDASGMKIGAALIGELFQSAILGVVTSN